MLSKFKEEQEWFLAYFDRADIKYINPGRKVNVYIGKKRWIATICGKTFIFCGPPETYLIK